MKKHPKSTEFLAIIFLVAAVAGGCLDDTVAPTQPQPSQSTPSAVLDPEQIAYSLVVQASWPEVDGIEASAKLRAGEGLRGEATVRSLQREPIIGDVVHYEFLVQVGPGPFDIIGIHRVVRERAPNSPIRARTSIFLLHGDYKDFEGCFLPGLLSTRTPDDFGFAVYLAQNDVDVWGIDQAWCLVPSSESDFSFMQDWGMQRQVDDLNTAVSVARHARRMTGNGFSRMILCGYSSGSTTGFALLNQETQVIPGHRNVGGFIPVDQGVATDVTAWEEAMCGAVAGYQALIDSGQYQDYNPLPTFGVPALTDPDGPSELIPGFTNIQAGLALGVFPFFEGVSGHFLAGTFDGDGVPTGLQYTDLDHWVDFMINAPPYEPLAFERDEYITNCPAAGDVPWDDHLGDIEVPILFVMAGGGFGYTGDHTLSLLGSKDISRLRVSLYPPEEALLDFAHIDLFLASTAPDLVWQPILTWLQDHTLGNGPPPGVGRGATTP